MGNTWHWNCDDCKATGGATLWPDGYGMAHWLAEKHATREHHHVRLWPRGMREQTRMVNPAVEVDDE